MPPDEGDRATSGSQHHGRPQPTATNTGRPERAAETSHPRIARVYPHPPMARDLDFADVVLAPERELNADEFVLLWVDDWYDGPLGAMIARGGEQAYLAIHDRSVLGTAKPWRWIVLRPSPAALDEQNRRHALFAHHVGEHWCCHAAPTRASMATASPRPSTSSTPPVHA